MSRWAVGWQLRWALSLWLGAVRWAVLNWVARLLLWWREARRAPVVTTLRSLMLGRSERWVTRGGKVRLDAVTLVATDVLEEVWPVAISVIAEVWAVRRGEVTVVIAVTRIVLLGLIAFSTFSVWVDIPFLVIGIVSHFTISVAMVSYSLTVVLLLSP